MDVTQRLNAYDILDRLQELEKTADMLHGSDGIARGDLERRSHRAPVMDRLVKWSAHLWDVKQRFRTMRDSGTLNEFREAVVALGEAECEGQDMRCAMPDTFRERGWVEKPLHIVEPGEHVEFYRMSAADLKAQP